MLLDLKFFFHKRSEVENTHRATLTMYTFTTFIVLINRYNFHVFLLLFSSQQHRIKKSPFSYSLNFTAFTSSHLIQAWTLYGHHSRRIRGNPSHSWHRQGGVDIVTPRGGVTSCGTAQQDFFQKLARRSVQQVLFRSCKRTSQATSAWFRQKIGFQY